MQNDRFNESIATTLEFSQKMLTRKSAGYSTSEDRLHNFRTAAALNGTTMEQALWGMLTKHIVSLRDMVQTGHPHSPDLWDEKIGDAINYLAILRAIASETEWTPESDGNRNKFGVELIQKNKTPLYSAGKDEQFNSNQQRDIDSIKRVADKHSY